jgi:hypothetical protein
VNNIDTVLAKIALALDINGVNVEPVIRVLHCCSYLATVCMVSRIEVW